MSKLIPGVLLLFLLTASGQAGSDPRAPVMSTPGRAGLATALPSAQLHNLFQVSTNVFSGSAPENEAALAEIARLGVKTIITVDGSKPDVEAARKHGLRYIHLPFGYDGIPTNRVAELVKAAQSVPGPIYVHCHHGLHRGPAAVAVMCEATSGWTTNQAIAWLRQAGTDPDYAGLYRSAIQFRAPDAAALARVTAWPEIFQSSSLVDAMVAIDQEFDRLKAAQKSSWSGIPREPDLAPAQTATILWEHFRELRRSDDTSRRPGEYRTKLAAAEEATDQLRALLRNSTGETASRDAALQAVGRSCASCHKAFRN